MTYAVKEVFHTIQGEGVHAGRAAVFIRFAGCNLWSGDRARREGAGSCAAWCDTDFVGTNGVNGGKYSTSELVKQAVACANERPVGVMCVLTGGEPTLQVDDELTGALKDAGFYVAMETNGTRPIPAYVDWVTVSPKHGGAVVVSECDELKVVVPQILDPVEMSRRVRSTWKSVQPRDGHPKSLVMAMAFVKENPSWRLSVQLHKLLGLP